MRNAKRLYVLQGYFVHKSLHKFFAKYKKSPLFATLHKKLQQQNTKK